MVLSCKVGVGILIINDRGKILIRERNDPKDPDNLGRKELLGGYIKPGETPAQAITRILIEEAGDDLKVEIIAPFTTLSSEPVSDPSIWSIGIPHVCKLISGKPKINPDYNRVTNFWWISLEQALDDPNLTPGTRTQLEDFLEWLSIVIDTIE
ncbi:NUDIX domain-containing protein [Candidatus Saccharibacteria bacterium]|nr:NUDIX domain-containing protein [Candidatus Saccharibacteria bacterium]MCB9834866.1 NUDIX domain-containing protein [Candidatus Nomurabacteria bacterium]